MNTEEVNRVGRRQERDKQKSGETKRFEAGKRKIKPNSSGYGVQAHELVKILYILRCIELSPN